ncbi:hypothetical protein UFOVP495_15 [uncultured Caudovirales phage]|uniref:Uncharacterized protein n=1 Tax=uncultured Caudovirales phage TaxID=2100421 RepID=A0A6J5MLC2_9CAUD|nr:hypothetical protein UFOVP495_15 [uncultured Caudovirales phage]
MNNTPSSFDSLYRSLILGNLEAANFQPNGVISEKIIINCLQGINSETINITPKLGGGLYTLNTAIPNNNPASLIINFINLTTLDDLPFILTFEINTVNNSIVMIDCQVDGIHKDFCEIQGPENNAFDLLLTIDNVNVINAPDLGGSNNVLSFNGRFDNVVSQSGDYSMSQISGVATIAQGGTGQTTQQTAINALAGNVTSGQYLQGNGTNVIMSAIQAADVPTLNQNTTGSAGSFTGNLVGDVSGTQTTTSVNKINGVTLSTLSTGLLKNTTATGVPTIAIAGTDYVIPSGNITGTASNITSTTNTTLTTLPNLNLSANSQIATINNNIALKENIINPGTITQYFRGDKTFQTFDKIAVGLGNANNTSDLNKPISTATQAALDTLNNNIALKENIINPGIITQYFRGDKTFQTFDKIAVGLGNANNTSDLNKPISTATQAALNLKSNITDVYSKLDLDNILYPNYIRPWFRRSQSSLNLNVSTVPLNCTPFFNAATVEVQGVANPLIYNSATNVISVDPTTNYFYSFSLRIRLKIRLIYSNTGIFFFELRRDDNVTIIDTYILTIPTGVGSVNTPTFFSFEINTRIFSGGTDLFQTAGFTLYFYGTAGDTATFAGTDGINFQMIFESN